MYIRTIGPLFTPLRLTRGLDPRSDIYSRILKALPAQSGEIRVPNSETQALETDFSDSRRDDLDLRLFVWTPEVEKGEPRLICHVYPNGVSVFETEFALENPVAEDDLETVIQTIAQGVFDRHAGALADMLRRVHRNLPSDLVDPLANGGAVSSADIGWIARAVVMSDAERRSPANADFITAWLETSARPEEAALIIEGKLDAAMTWLNYIIIETDPEEVSNLFAAARVAQFFYAAQDKLNLEAQNELANAETGTAVRKVETRLIASRRRMQMLRILYQTQKGYLSRFRRRKFDDFMAVWDYDDLVENGERIVEATNSRIAEITTKRAERSSFVTDLILVGIALVAVIEASLYFTEYSREVMSRPALGYTDEDASWILKWVASIDTDAMLMFSAVAILILVLFYVFYKTRR